VNQDHFLWCLAIDGDLTAGCQPLELHSCDYLGVCAIAELGQAGGIEQVVSSGDNDCPYVSGMDGREIARVVAFLAAGPTRPTACGRSYVDREVPHVPLDPRHYCLTQRLDPGMFQNASDLSGDQLAHQLQRGERSVKLRGSTAQAGLFLHQVHLEASIGDVQR